MLDSAPWAAFAHNALLQAVLDLGLIGTAVLGAILAIGFVSLLKSRVPRLTRITVMALMIFLAVNSLGSESFAGAPGIEVLLLLMCVLCVASRTQKPSTAVAGATA